MLALKFQVHAKEPVTYRVHISIKNKNLVIPVSTKGIPNGKPCLNELQKDNCVKLKVRALEGNSEQEGTSAIFLKILNSFSRY